VNELGVISRSYGSCKGHPSDMVNSGVCDLMYILGQQGIVLMGVVLDYVNQAIGRHSEIIG